MVQQLIAAINIITRQLNPHICGYMHGSYLFTFPGANILETLCILFWTQNKHPRNTYLDLCFSYMCWHSFRILLVMLRANYIRTTLHKMFGNRKGNLRIQPEGLPPFEPSLLAADSNSAE